MRRRYAGVEVGLWEGMNASMGYEERVRRALDFCGGAGADDSREQLFTFKELEHFAA